MTLRSRTELAEWAALPPGAVNERRPDFIGSYGIDADEDIDESNVVAMLRLTRELFPGRPLRVDVLGD
jgi:hypothetical protein